jgi:hypothetical protein
VEDILPMEIMAGMEFVVAIVLIARGVAVLAGIQVMEAMQLLVAATEVMGLVAGVVLDIPEVVLVTVAALES